MDIPLDPKQIVCFEEFLMSQIIQQEALIRLLVEKGGFTKQKLLENEYCLEEGILTN